MATRIKSSLDKNDSHIFLPELKRFDLGNGAGRMCFDSDGSQEMEKRQLPYPEEVNSVQLNNAEKQLEVIKDSLKDFIDRIVKEEPDYVIFLDKSARMFASPINKYLGTRNFKKKPFMGFYNDQDLKGKYLNGTLDSDFVLDEFADIKNKKVFFVDETFSSGKGAASLKNVKELLDNPDIFYFALTQDLNQHSPNNPPPDIPNYKQHLKVVDKINEDSNFVIYPNEISHLFSRSMNEDYISEYVVDGRVRTVGKNRFSKLISADSKKDNIPSSYDFFEYPCNKATYDQLKRREVRNTISAVKSRIYQVLLSQ